MATNQTQTWARWDSGNKRVWHALRVRLIFGRWITDNTTLCGRGVPPQAVTFRGSIIGDSVPACRSCERTFLRESGL